MFRGNKTVLAILAALVIPSSIQAQSRPRRALEASDPAVQTQAVRLRITNTAWDYMKLTLRDTFKIWGRPGIDDKGGNILLEPGYDTETASGGLGAFSPMNFNVGPYSGVSVVYRSNSPTIICDNQCGADSVFNCKTCPVSTITNRKWVQSRRPGFSGSDYPAIPYRLTYLNDPAVFPGYPAYDGYGYYVPAGAPPDPTAYCPANVATDYYQLQICTDYFSFDPGSGKSGQCTGGGIDILVGTVHYSLRVSIAPNMRQEYALDPVDSWDPTLAPAVRRGPGAGTVGKVNYAVATETGCTAYSCNDTGNCSCNWLNQCNDAWLASCPAIANQSSSLSQVPLPQDQTYNPATPYDWFRSGAADTSGGTYFRQGDKQAIHANIYRMQIHSSDRASAYPSDCEIDMFYTGKVVNGKPQYVVDNQKISNCMRPLMYYDTVKAKWTQCDAFDTWNSDLSYNINNDDAKRVYPGDPVTGLPSVNGSPTRTCGAQPCSAGAYCANPPATRRTTDKADLFRAGGGWYMFDITNLDVIPGSNVMNLQLVARDLRLEATIVGDSQCQGLLCPFSDTRDRRMQGRLHLSSLVIDAQVRLFSIDETSCNPTYPPSCGKDGAKATPWLNINDNKNNPDQFFMDVGNVSLTVNRATPTVSGDQEEFVAGNTYEEVLNDFWGLGIRLIGDMVMDELEGSLVDMIGPALSDIMAAVPNLNTVFGDPMVFDRALIETGFYLFGDRTAPAPVNYNTVFGGTYTYPQLWPVVFQGGPGGSTTRDVVDLRMSLGFKPMAFKKVAGSWNPNLLVVDTAEPPLATSEYGIPTLKNPVLLGSQTKSCPTPGSPLYRGCSRVPATVPALDEDQEYDNDDYCLPDTLAASGLCLYRNQQSGASTEIAARQVFPEFWEGPIDPAKKPPTWCLSPAAFRADATPTNMNLLYPKTQWLSFDATVERNAAGTLVGYKNTKGDWDTVPGSYVLKQNYNDGTTENLGVNPIANVPYDFSVHVHQRTIAELLHAIFASGLGCIELSDSGLPAVEGVDTAGMNEFLGTLLSVERFAAFMPELPNLFPNGKIKIQISPTKTPHVRAGISRFTPQVNWGAMAYGGTQPLAIVNEPYALGIAVPDVQIKFIVVSQGIETTLMTAYWSPVLGFYMRGVRQCLQIDPWANQPECTSQFKNVRTVSGYNELFFSMNDPQMQAAFENTLDRTVAGHYTTPIGSTKGSAQFVITQNYCDLPRKCNAVHLADSLPTLLTSYLHLLLVTRLSFMNFTIDMLYVGPDGPSDDGVGLTQAAGGGDYLGIYANFLGNLDVFGLIGALGGTEGLAGEVKLAPGGYPLNEALQPKASVQLPEHVDAPTWFATAKPAFPIGIQGALKDSAQAYTWRVDRGFWAPPSISRDLVLPYLTQGEHELEVRAIEDAKMGSLSQLVPTKFTFRVDTVPPAVLLSEKEGFFGDRVLVDASDLQTEKAELTGRYRWDTGEWKPLEGNSITLSKASPGRHTLTVRVSDLAGNAGEATLNVERSRGGWGCQAGGGDYSLTFAVLLGLLGLGVRRRRV